MNNEEQDKINAEHIRKAEANRNADYVDLWKKTKFTRAKQDKCSKAILTITLWHSYHSCGFLLTKKKLRLGKVKQLAEVCAAKLWDWIQLG